MPIDRETFNLRDFGMQVARHLADWTPVEQEEDRRERFCLANGAYEIEINWSKHASRAGLERVTVSVNHWPTYTKYEGGRESSERVGPWNLYDPKEAAPKITVAIERGAAVVAKEITRRVLPEYERIYKRCAEVAATNQDYQNQSRDGWAAICAAISKDPTRNHHYIRVGKDETRISIEHRGGGTARIELDLKTAGELRAVLAAPEAARPAAGGRS